MKMAENIDISGISAEIVCALMIANQIFFNYGAPCVLEAVGTNTVIFAAPDTDIIADNIVRLIRSKLTPEFSVSMKNKMIRIAFIPKKLKEPC